MARIGRKVLFTGRVQGVGFRMTACEVARRYDVTGHVRNLPDGSVEMVAEGEPETLDAFVAAVTSAMCGLVDETRSTDREPQGRFTGFTVAY